MANETAPTIKWERYYADGTKVQLAGNTVDYDAVQAGNYSNVICVRPKFADETPPTIGKVRFWWNDIVGGVNGDDATDMAGGQWVMKYYVSYCDKDAQGVTGNVGTMINIFNDTASKAILTTQRTTTSSYSGFCRSTWENNTTGAYVCMQPIPLFLNGFTNSGAEIKNFESKYGATWYSQIYRTLEEGEEVTTDSLYYAVGGDLNGVGQGCNVASTVKTEFPYIFLAIRPPSDATAGVWSGFSCRMSFVWPWSDKNSISNV